MFSMFPPSSILTFVLLLTAINKVYSVSTITIAVSLPWGGTSWPLGESISPVILKAISDSTEVKGYLPNHEVKFVWFDTQCDSEYAYLLPIVGKAFKPDVFIGPPCSVVVEGAVSIAELLYGPMTTPIVSWGAANPAFADKDEYPMVS